MFYLVIEISAMALCEEHPENGYKSFSCLWCAPALDVERHVGRMAKDGGVHPIYISAKLLLAHFDCEFVDVREARRE